MGRIAYLDCFAGVSGDMILGAILDAGVPLAALREELSRLPLSGYRLEAAQVRRATLAATQATVVVEGPQPPRTPKEIAAVVQASSLPTADKEKALAVFGRLAAAEAKVHGVALDEVHLHEVGAADAIVDVVGAVVGLRLLGVEELYASPLPLGGGSTTSEHGRLPLPAPATLELLAQVGAPVTDDASISGETVTPTGAAIVATLARFQRPAMAIQRVGYGAGSRDPADRPNVLRLWLGEAVGAHGHAPLLLLETNIDDTTPEVLGYALERLLAVGALDAWFTPIQMKKGRPAVTLSALCAPEAEAAVVGAMLRETSTLGVRVYPVRRHEARREELTFQSSLGPAAVKVKYLPDQRPWAAPEYEACRRLAQERGLPLLEVYRIVQAEAEELLRRRETSGEA